MVAARDGVARVSVVIPAHNAGGTIGEQLDALAAQTCVHPFEVVVVANRCTDETAEVVASFAALPELHLVSAEDHAGSSYARNVGWQAATGDVLLFCDADDAVAPDWVEGMVAALSSADVVGGALVPFGGEPEWAVRCSIAPVTELPVASDGYRYVVGASVGVRRDVAMTLPGWDERFTGGGDDIAFSVAAQRAGFRLGFAAGARCRYRVRTTLRSAAAQQRRYGRSGARLWATGLLTPRRGLLGEAAADVVRAPRRLLGARSADDLRIAYVRASFHIARAAEAIHWWAVNRRRTSGSGTLAGRVRVRR